MNAKGGPAVAYTEQRLASIASAIPLTTDKTVIEANALMATALASQSKRRLSTVWQILKFLRG